MVKRERSKIGQRLVLGFMTLIVLYVLLGIVAMYHLKDMSSLTRTMYDHPLVVSNAALNVKAAVFKLHANMSELLHLTSYKGVEPLLNEINTNETEVVQSLDLVRQLILGLEGKQIERETRDLFEEWVLIRWDMITLINDQKRQKAEALIKGKGRDQILLLEKKAQRLCDYSRARAAEFMKHTEYVNRRMAIVAYIILGIGVPFAAIVAFFTISSVLRAERSIKENEERYALSQRIGKIGLFEWNVKSGKVILADETRKIIGLGPDDFQESDFQATRYIHPDDVPVWEKEWKACLKEGKELRFEIRVKRPDNDQEIWLSVLGGYSKDPDDRPERMLGVVMDITERKYADVRHKELEKQLIQAQKMEAIGRLAGGVAHDFNNLLSIILGYSEMLMEDIPFEHPHHMSLAEVHDASVRAQGVTRQLLAFGKKQVLEIKHIDINQVIQNFEKLLRRVITEDIVLQIYLAQEPAVIKADSSQIEQVMMNLVVNAKDAMPNGGELTIETSLVDIEAGSSADEVGIAGGRYVLISVSDTGDGISNEDMDRIYEPFFTTKGREKGTGLGLATVYGIVTQHGGAVLAHSDKGQGTTFKIYMPVCVVREPAGEHWTQPEIRRDIEDATILVVEDDEALAKLAYRLLEKHEYRVIQSKSPEDAVEKAEAFDGEIDLLLTDVIMPGMKGPDVFEAVKAFHPEIKVLYMSGYTGNVITRHGVLKENIHFLQKPFSKQMFLEKVRETLISPHAPDTSPP